MTHGQSISWAFQALVRKVANLSYGERAIWGITNSEDVLQITQAFEYYAKTCAAGEEVPTADGFREHVIACANRLAKREEEQAKQDEDLEAA